MKATRKQTAFRIPEPLLKEAKADAVENGYPSLNAWIVQLIRKELLTRKNQTS